MADAFSTQTAGLEAPAANALNVTPNDGADLSFVTRALHLDSAGSVKMTMLGGQAVTMDLDRGYHPLRVSRVWATGTTATGITALW